jgi:hypothetical protein
MTRKIFAAVLALAAGACADLNYNAPTAWQGQLAPTTLEDVGGSVAAAYQGVSIEAGLDLHGAPNTSYGWQINRGTCAAPGQMVGGRGSYPDVNTNDIGTGRLERTFINSSLNDGGAYHAVLVRAADRTVILACGALEQLEF